MKPGTEFAYRVTIETVCRCGKKVRIGRTPNLLMDDGSPAPIALHAEPPCKDFVKLDLVSYLRWLRGATEN